MLTSFGTKIVAAVTAGFLCTAPVMAANYGGFGSSYSEVINPKEAVINDEAVSTGEFKSGKEGLQNLLRVVQTLKTDLVSPL